MDYVYHHSCYKAMPEARIGFKRETVSTLQGFLTRTGAPAIDKMQAENDDWDDLLPTQPSTAPAPTTNARCKPDEQMLCIVCSLNMSRWSILDREIHMNACLDRDATKDVAVECPMCGKMLTDYNEQRRMAHTNLCLDKIQRQETAAAQPESKRKDVEVAGVPKPAPSQPAYVCPICGTEVPGESISVRIQHVKRCGRRFGVRPSDLATINESLATEAQGKAQLERSGKPHLTLGNYHLDYQQDVPTAAEAEVASAEKKDAFSVMMRASTTVVASAGALNTIEVRR